MKAGAVDFIEKPFSEDTILSAIRIAMERFSRGAEQSGAVNIVEARLKTLTVREREVLEGLMAGLPNKTIAYDLTISTRTVEVHRANVMTKMAAGSLPELVRMVLLSRAPGL
jgi:two-component system response regulator FixJ